jgi:hypothetical protein
MTRLVLLVGVGALLFAAPLGALAGDSPAPAAQEQRTAPKVEGCMPGGGCCGGSTACPKAERAKDGRVTGGCPCQKAKQAQQAPPPAAP